MLRKYFLIIFLISYQLVPAQTSAEDNLGSWLMYFGTHQINEKYSIHYETQLRNYEVFGNFFQLLPRVGLNYNIAENSMVTAGYAWIPTQPIINEGWNNELVTENRIWEQFILRNKINNIKIRHRYRLEQRWVKYAGITTYKNRARYMLSFRIPLNKNPEFPLFISLYDEIFLNISKTPFDQNRLYSALGIQVNKNMNIQAGYLRHRLGSQNLDRLQLAIFLNTGNKERD